MRSRHCSGSRSSSNAAAPTPTRCAPSAVRRRRSTGCPQRSWRRSPGRGASKSIPGVGKSTAQVIEQALDGRVPDYLAKLEGEGEPDDLQLDGSARELLASLRGDCHSHSDWSDGGSPILEMAEAARALGHEYLVLTDHSARLTVAHGLNAERLREQLDVLAGLNEQLAPFRILTGIEVDILEDGSLDQELDLLAELDVVVASVHSKLRMDADQMTARMLAAIESPHTDILGHCTGRLITGRGRPQSTFDAEAVFSACARTGTAVEINSPPRAPGPAPGPAPTGSRARVLVQHRHRRPRPRAARLAPPGVQEGRGRRARPRADREPQVDGRPAGLGGDARWLSHGDAGRAPPGGAHAGQARARAAPRAPGSSTSPSGTVSAASSSATVTRSSSGAATRSR